MPEVTVTKSEDINESSSISLRNSQIAYRLDSINDTGDSLIILYMYQLPKYPEHGIKVGMTTCKPGKTFWESIQSRIRVQKHELALNADQYEKYGMERRVIYWAICLDARNDSFKDYYVHRKIIVKNAGITVKDQEWFCNIPADELIDIVEECRREGETKEIYQPRKEQRECIDSLKAYFERHLRGGRFLMNCKMRFGKSFTTFKYCEEENLNRILILTFVPAVESSWSDDLAHIKKEYHYFTDKHLRRDSFNPAFIDEPFVMFLSLQNYLGKDKDSKDTKDRIRKLQSLDWDLVVLDEYHFGAWNDRTRTTFAVDDKPEDLDPEYLDNLTSDVVKKFKIHTKRTICLSGTPFKALATNEFAQDAIYSYTYFDEQRNKYPNSEKNDFDTVDPDYAQFPDMKILGYNMSSMFGNMTAAVRSGNKLYGRTYFSLNQFFKTKQDVNPNQPAVFIYEKEVKDWLEIIKGANPLNGKYFPYSDIDRVGESKHTLWLLPTRTSTEAMAELLRKDSYFKKYQIINLSGPGIGVGPDAYDYLMKGINESENTGKLGSIALTVNKLTLGVTVKPWMAVFVLKDLASPEQYFQSIFRVQTPNQGKKAGYVYDFNVDRAAALLLKFAEKSANQKGGKTLTKLQITKLIVRYLPIYLNGDMSRPISEDVFYELAEFGDTTGVPLSRKISDTSKTTRIEDDYTIAQMMGDPEVRKIMSKVFAHAKFKKHPTSTPIPPSPFEENIDSGKDNNEEIRNEGREIGYQSGKEDFNIFAEMDDDTLSDSFLEYQEKRAKEKCPDKYSGDVEYPIYYNGFVLGYRNGVNAPVKKLKCGQDDGYKFVPEVKKKFGNDIQWTRETGPDIKQFLIVHLNKIENIPEKYRSALFKSWYAESFIYAVKKRLTPQKKKPKPGESVEDADNVLKHLLARLFEFLYISVYRETTFDEIFRNANPEIFLEAVGITKEEFTILNRYHIFEENTLNNCIRDFFVNESLGSRLDMNDEEVRKNYRNSFDWFGYGIIDEDNNSSN